MPSIFQRILRRHTGAAPETPSYDPEVEVKRWRGGAHTMVGLTALAALVFGLGAWSASAMIAGAVVANARVKVDAERQVVQHPEGGVVTEILVRDGDAVRAGDVLLRLDDSEIAADLAVTESRHLETLALIARLTAERDGGAELRLSPPLEEAVARGAGEVSLVIAGQQTLLSSRVETETRRLSQIAERQQQVRSEIDALEAHRAAFERERELVLEELAAQKKLLRQRLIEQPRVRAQERTLAEIDGRIGEISARIAQARGRIAEFGIEMENLKAGRREEAIAELRTAEADSDQLEERLRALRTRLARLEVRSPRDGVVTESQIFALRAVLRPADPVLYVVPSDSKLIVEARIEDAAIDRLYPGQSARVRFPSFNARTTPELDGEVTRISADTVEDERTGASFYEVEIALPDTEIARLNGQRLTPGMPAEVFVATDERLAISYLTRPFTDYFERAFREE
ncbi:MAG: HlyD family type I secretion periplasmic adaptor subunit [Pseudomonadota bacterium]